MANASMITEIKPYKQHGGILVHFDGRVPSDENVKNYIKAALGYTVTVCTLVCRPNAVYFGSIIAQVKEWQQ